MRNFFGVLLVWLLFMPSAWALDYGNQPKDFYGLPWGATVSELAKSGQGFVPHGQGGGQAAFSVYRSPTHPGKFYGLAFDTVDYCFFRGRFFRVRAVKSNVADVYGQNVYASMVQAHGPPTQQNSNLAKKTATYWWQGDITFVVLVNDFARRETTLYFYHYPLHQQWEAARRQGGAR